MPISDSKNQNIFSQASTYYNPLSYNVYNIRHFPPYDG